MKNKVLTLLVLLTMITASLFGCNKEPSEGLEFAVNEEDGFCTVTGLGSCTDQKIVIPSEYEGYPVTGIDKFAIVTGSGVIAPFQSDSIKSVTLPDTITSIGMGAFYGCTALKSIHIPASVSNLCESEFENPPFNPFAYCSSLSKITIDEENTVYTVRDNCLIEKDTGRLIAGCKNSVIPTDGSITSIENHAFAGCTGLKELVIPASVTYIAEGAFWDCNGLNSIIVEEGNPNYRSENNCLIETKTNRVILGCKNSVIPNGVREIYKKAFLNCSGLKEITIPQGVDSIDFPGCSGLKSITIPNSVTSVDLSNCSGLTSIDLPSRVEYLDLSGCTGLTNIVIPQKVESLNLSDCNKLTSIVIPQGVTMLRVDGCTGLTSLAVPDHVTSLLSITECTSLTTIELNTQNRISIFQIKNCPNLREVRYNGTMDEWKYRLTSHSIIEGSFTVICTDGEIEYTAAD